MKLKTYQDISLNRALGEFLADEQGATAIEYSLIAAMVALGCIGALKVLGTTESGSWAALTKKVGDASK